MSRPLHLSVALDHIAAAGSARATHRSDPAGLTALTGLAEQGGLDFVTVGSPAEPGLPVRAVELTRRIGVVPTLTTTRTDPSRITAALAALDRAGKGRAGWLVDAHTTETDARTVETDARGTAPDVRAIEADALATEADALTTGPVADPWAGAADAVAAVSGRWDGGPGDAGGPHPPVAVALDVHDSDGQWELAAAHADLVLLDADDPATVRLARAALLRRVAETGRDPDGLRVLLRVAVGIVGVDGGGDRPLPAAETRFTGTAADLAALLADWRAACGVHGFHLLPASAPADLAAVVHETVPPLRGRGLLRAAYTGRTLRDHLGLPAPRPAPAGH